MAWLATPPGTAAATVFASQKEALELAFPEADELRAETRVLSRADADRVRALSRCDLETQIVKLYSGWREGQLLGFAFIDVHTVRTLPEAFLVVLAPDGTVRSVRMLAFHEPLDYLPTDRWVQQFVGKRSGERLRVGSDVHAILGATLSAQAVTCSVRRVQALHSVLVPAGSDPAAASQSAAPNVPTTQAARSAEVAGSAPPTP